MKYYAVHISYPSWEGASHPMDTPEQAEEWLLGKIDETKRDWGYLVSVDENGEHRQFRSWSQIQNERNAA